ncbi:MAG: glycosyltransferase family 39 protein [Candidatus Shapirobacteria bacterium]
MKKWPKFLFVVILLLSAFIRFYQLDHFPPSPNWDEVSHGVNAQSILETGADQWGQKFPLFNFRAYGDYPTVANMYFTIPFIKILGLNTLSIRLPSAIFGFLFVPLIFFLCQILFGQTRISLIAMFITAIAPWSFFPSRAVFQSTTAITFLIAAITFFFYFYYHHKSYLIFLSSLFLGLSMYAYHNTRLIAPLIFVYLFWSIKKSFKKVVFPILLFLFFAVPSLINLLSPESRARGYWVSLINPSAINLINEQRRLYEGPPILNLILHNKVTYAVPQITLNFLNFFNPIPLFFTGTGQYQFNVAGKGLLFPVWLPFFYLGLLSLWRHRQKPSYRFLIFWLIVGLFPAIITSGDFASIRATTAMPVYLILTALGINQFLSSLPIILIIIASLLSFSNYLYLYITSYAQNYSQSWQFGYQEAIEIIKPIYSKYDHIYFTKKYGEPHEFILFFWPWSLKSFQNDPNLGWDYHAYWYWVNSFDKFIFLNDWEITKYSFPPNSLLVTSPQNYSGKPVKISAVKFLDQSVAFDIVGYE